MYLSQVATSGPAFFNLAPWIVLFPIIGLLINIAFGGRMGEKAVGTIASLASGLAFVVAVLLGISLIYNPDAYIVPFADWIVEGDLHLSWAFQVDTLSVTMMLVVSGVGTLIHIYAIGYMHEDVRLNGDPGRFRRFFVYLNLFIATMMVLVGSDSYLMLFVGWEGVGLCSYLLIGFWYEKGKDGIGNALAAKKAFIANRVGDFGFLLALFTMFGMFHAFEFQKVFETVPNVAQAFPGAMLLLTLFLLLGVTGKSAQLPLYVWLPDAMAGPTPVSALIHAATMVTAGVYLIARSSPIYSLVPIAQNTVAIVGGLTAFFAATIAVAQFDIKKVLAYSTISQLGYMVAAVGMGAYTAGMFHLITHAFFKALLFLGAGSVIQGVEHGHHHVEHDPRLKRSLKGHEFDPQDMRNMGGLRTRMKTTFWTYLIAALALSGIVPFAGFWSKDEILAESNVLNPVVYWLLVAAAFLTAFYMGRQILMVFFGEPRSEPAAHAAESPAVMTVPLIILAGLSLFGGALNFPGVDTLTHWLDHTIVIEEAAKQIEAGGKAVSSFNPMVAVFSTIVAVLALFVAWIVYSRRYKELLRLPPARRSDDPLRSMLGPLFTAMENKWWVDELYHAIIVKPYDAFANLLARGETEAGDKDVVPDFMHDVVIVGGYRSLSDFLALVVDLGFIDATANGLAGITQAISSRLRRIQTGFVRNYALSVFLGVVVILGYLIWRVGIR
jgi:NADH-quinone oxidoreductase subunit L